MKTKTVNQNPLRLNTDEFSICEQELSLKLAAILLERITLYNRLNKFCESIHSTLRFDTEVIDPILYHFINGSSLSKAETKAFFEQEKAVYTVDENMVIITDFAEWEIDYDVYSNLMGFDLKFLRLVNEKSTILDTYYLRYLSAFEEACREYFFEGDNFENLQTAAKYLTLKVKKS